VAGKRVDPTTWLHSPRVNPGLNPKFCYTVLPIACLTPPPPVYTEARLPTNWLSSPSETRAAMLSAFGGDEARVVASRRKVRPNARVVIRAVL